MTIQDQYIETIRQTQETWADAVKSFTKDAQRTFEKASPLFSYVDPSKSIETLREAQETWADAVKSFTNDAQRAFEQPSPLFSYVDPSKSIDQVFDFWEKSLEAQRTVAKQLVGVSISAGEKVREQVESVSALVRQNADSVGQALREQADSVTAAFQSAAVSVSEQTYANLNKAELQDELGARDLPKTGNVDELRARLVADDLK